MLVIRHDLSYHRPLSERMIVSFPQLLLETTAAQLLNQTSPNRKKSAAKLDKPQPFKAVGLENSKVDLTAMEASGWQNFCWSAVIKVPGGLDTTLINPKTGTYCFEVEPRNYKVLIALENAMPEFVWPSFAREYEDVAISLVTGEHLDIRRSTTSRRPIANTTNILCTVPPEDWLTAITRYIPQGATTGPSRWAQNSLKSAFEEAFRTCDVKVSCTGLNDPNGCSWFDGQVANASVDWVDRGYEPKNASKYASLIDTRAGQRLASHKGSMTSQALANDETLWRDRPDEILDPADVRPDRRSHVIQSRPIGSKERGGYRLPDGRFVSNTGMVYNDQGDVVAYANGDKFTPIEIDPDATEVEPCVHITRTLLSFLDGSYNTNRMMAQGLCSCLWTRDGREAVPGLVNAWKTWANGSSLCKQIYEELSEYVR